MLSKNASDFLTKFMCLNYRKMVSARRLWNVILTLCGKPFPTIYAHCWVHYIAKPPCAQGSDAMVSYTLHPKRTQGTASFNSILKVTDLHSSLAVSNTYIKTKTDFSLLSNGNSLLVTLSLIHTRFIPSSQPSYILLSFQQNSSGSRLIGYIRIVRDGISQIPSLLYYHFHG